MGLAVKGYPPGAVVDRLMDELRQEEHLKRVWAAKRWRLAHGKRMTTPGESWWSAARKRTVDD